MGMSGKKVYEIDCETCSYSDKMTELSNEYAIASYRSIGWVIIRMNVVRSGEPSLLTLCPGCAEQAAIQYRDAKHRLFSEARDGS